MRSIITSLVCILLWSIASVLAGPALLPTPIETGHEMLRLFSESQSLIQVLITFYRAATGLAIGVVCGCVLGLACGFMPGLMKSFSPLVAGMQACPTIVWISILMVWAGSGSTVPIACVATAVFPVIFLNVAQGTSALDKRLFAMARFYHVPASKILRQLVVPGIASYVLAALAFALSVTWKVTVTTEFITSGSGIGAEIFWAFRLLNIPRLFCWAIVLIALGVLVDCYAIQALRRKTEELKE